MKERIVSALVALLILIPCIIAGDIFFVSIACVVGLLAFFGDFRFTKISF